MAKITIQVLQALRKTVASIQSSPDYQWGHMGSCNCGYLAQQITQRSKQEIHSMAMERSGDWNEQLNDYCPTSGLRMDLLISEILHAGFDAEDLKHLERLSAPEILKRLPLEKRILRHNSREDVVLYLRTWADIIEENLLSRIDLIEFIDRADAQEHHPLTVR